MLQLTIIRIEGYGPWTLTLGSDREGELQKLQARVYYEAQRIFSDKGCLVFSNRFDEYFAITNGLSAKDHAEVQQEMAGLFPNLRMSMAIGKGETPFKANIEAYNSRKNLSLLDEKKRIFGSKESAEKIIADSAQIMHIDVDGSARVSGRLSPYEITSLVMKIYSMLSEEFLKKECLTFFLGGDNFMVISNGATKEDADMIIKKVTAAVDVKFNCGIGIGKTGRKAAEGATQALDTIRELRDRGTIQTIYEVRNI